VYVFTIKYFV